MKKMKILMIGNDASVKGGITSVITQLLAHNWNKENIDICFIPTYIDAGNLKKILFFINAYRKINVKLKTDKPEIVHIHMSYKGSFTRKYLIHRLCQKYGVTDVIHLHGSEFKKWYDRCDDKKKERIRCLLKEAGTVIVLGNKWDEIIKSIEPTTNTLIVSNTVHVPEEQVRWNESFKILFMGVLIQRKGVSDLLQAVKILKDTEKIKNIKIIIAGTGIEEGALKKLRDELEITEYVEFVGWTSGKKKEKLFKECQMLVLPSYNEGLPIAILEAISYGMPIVATNVGDISAAVIDGKNGYLVKPGDSNGLAVALANIFMNKDVYLKFSAFSRQLAETRFSDDRYFGQLKECYMNLKEND